jgi:hypothetical protein
MDGRFGVDWNSVLCDLRTQAEGQRAAGRDQFFTTERDVELLGAILEAAIRVTVRRFFESRRWIRHAVQ